MIEFPESLLDGYRAFRKERYSKEHGLFRSLAKHGQTPEVMVIACCDSRSAPEIIFDASPGEIFVVRNVANLVPPYEPDGAYHATSAALEFAVEGLKIKHIVVLGHGRCGGIQAVLNPSEQPLPDGDFIGTWMRLLKPAADTISNDGDLSSAERQIALERAAIGYSIKNLRTFPCVSNPERNARLKLHGAWFDIASGELWTMNPATGEFRRAI